MRIEKIGNATLYLGDCLEVLRTLPDASVHTCVTSPPYYGLRDYGVDGQIGLEPTPDEYVATLVAVFREVRRVLRDDGTLWLNLGDSYFSTTKGTGGKNSSTLNANRDENGTVIGKSIVTYDPIRISPGETGLKPKDLIGIPWRVAFALQADGWYLRQDIIWHKPNPMPESVRDRCTKAHEYIFLLSKGPRYYFDAEAIKEPATDTRGTMRMSSRRATGMNVLPSGNEVSPSLGHRPSKRNKRSVWAVATKPFKCAHFATFPPDLIEPCILAGCPEGGTVLDPFGGAGTTGLVATQAGRDAVLCEINPEYVEMARTRIDAASLDASRRIEYAQRQVRLIA
jgi:DNA modification methylase